MKIYISGGITGITDARARFDRAQKALELRGYEVINPFEVEPFGCDGKCMERTKSDKHGVSHAHSYECVMKKDIRALTEVDAMAQLPGWQNSFGAGKEYDIAVVIGVDVRPLAYWLRTTVAVKDHVTQTNPVDSTASYTKALEDSEYGRRLGS